MTNDDDTSPIDDDALEQIRAEAVRQQSTGDETIAAPGVRRRPRKRAKPASQPPAADRPNPTAPPDFAVEAPVAETSPKPVPVPHPETEQSIDAAAPDTEPVDPAPPSGFGSSHNAPVQRDTADAEPSSWQPGSRLSTRVNPNPVPVLRKSSDRGMVVAAVILVVALLVAIGLYLVANAIVSDDGPTADVEETEQIE